MHFLDSMIAGVYQACAIDIITTCGTSHPLTILPCLISERDDLSDDCKSKVYLIISLYILMDNDTFYNNLY